VVLLAALHVMVTATMTASAQLDYYVTRSPVRTPMFPVVRVRLAGAGVTAMIQLSRRPPLPSLALATQVRQAIVDLRSIALRAPPASKALPPLLTKRALPQQLRPSLSYGLMAL
jgi:hypothetical protein